MNNGGSIRTIIEVDNLTKKYGSTVVLREASFKIESGVTGIVAPNGYGKTTFIEVCAGLRKGYSGVIKILGKSPDEVKERMGIVMEKPVFPKNLKVFDCIKLISYLYNKEFDEDLINVSQIGQIMQKKIGDLSSGYIKRLAFIIAVAHHPDVVLADELFSNVDRKAVEIMQQMIKRLAKEGMSFVISSHDIQELVGVSDRVITISDEKITQFSYTKRSGILVELKSSDNEALYNLLSEHYDVTLSDSSIKVDCKDLKPLLRDVSNFSGKIDVIRTIDEKEEFINEINKNIVGN